MNIISLNGLELDVEEDIIASPLLIAGQRKYGKSNLCKQLVKLMQDKVRVVVIDVMGEYDGLGLLHWDIKIENTVAMPAMLEESIRIDLSGVKLQDMFAYLAEFLEQLYYHQEKYKIPTVLVMEEAHRLVPEKGRVRMFPEQKKVVYWALEISATGRHHELGYIAIARRGAEIAKDIVNQCDSFILGRMKRSDSKALGVDSKVSERISKFGLGQFVLFNGEEKWFSVDRVVQDIEPKVGVPQEQKGIGRGLFARRKEGKIHITRTKIVMPIVVILVALFCAVEPFWSIPIVAGSLLYLTYLFFEKKRENENL